jgi:hypothetical protein
MKYLGRNNAVGRKGHRIEKVEEMIGRERE